MEDIDPDIVITFDSNGGNGNPDHISVSKITTKAFEKLDKIKNRRLYYTTLLPNSIASTAIDKLEVPQGHKDKFLKNLTTDDKNVTSIIKLESGELKNKMKLLQNYKSQFPDTKGNYYSMPLDILKRLAVYECYYLKEKPEVNNSSYNIVDML